MIPRRSVSFHWLLVCSYQYCLDLYLDWSWALLRCHGEMEIFPLKKWREGKANKLHLRPHHKQLFFHHFRGNARSLWMGVLWALTSGSGVAVALLQGSAGPLIGVAISASLLPPVVNCVSLFHLSRSQLNFHNIFPNLYLVASISYRIHPEWNYLLNYLKEKSKNQHNKSKLFLNLFKWGRKEISLVLKFVHSE